MQHSSNPFHLKEFSIFVDLNILTINFNEEKSWPDFCYLCVLAVLCILRRGNNMEKGVTRKKNSTIRHEIRNSRFISVGCPESLLSPLKMSQNFIEISFDASFNASTSVCVLFKCKETDLEALLPSRCCLNKNSSYLCDKQRIIKENKTHNLFMQQQYALKREKRQQNVKKLLTYCIPFESGKEKKNKKIYRKDIKQINLAYYCAIRLVSLMPATRYMTKYLNFVYTNTHTHRHISSRDENNMCVKRWNNVKKQEALNATINYVTWSTLLENLDDDD